MLAKILIVDDHPIARQSIRSILASESFLICGEAKDGREAIAKVVELKPDLVLLDISMPVMNGIQAAYEIRRIAPATKIVFFSNHDFPAVVEATRELGDSFVPKSEADALLIPTLNRLILTLTQFHRLLNASRFARDSIRRCPLTNFRVLFLRREERSTQSRSPLISPGTCPPLRQAAR